MKAYTGICQWFCPKKGYGFITANDKSYFVHYKSIKTSGFKTLETGQRVTFMAELGERGWSATEIIIVKDGVCS